MAKPDAHEISLETRRMTWAVVRHYEVDEKDELKGTMLADRAIRGYIHAQAGNVRIDWPNELPSPDAKEYHVICSVVSRRDIPKTVPDSRLKWRRPHPVGGRFVGDGKGNYDLKSVGGEYDFLLRGRREKVNGHGCEDMLWQKGIKGLPTACIHTFGFKSYVPPTLNMAAEKIEPKLKFTGGYEMPQEMLDLYEEIGKHSTIKYSWQRLNILYAGLTGELKAWSTGKSFLDSVAKYLDRRSLRWEENPLK